MQLTRNERKHFWQKVSWCAHGTRCRDCCWEWLGFKPKGPRSALQFMVNRGGKTFGFMVRRLVWELTRHRPIPPKHIIFSRCWNTECCSPYHFYAAPRKNIQKIRRRDGRTATLRERFASKVIFCPHGPECDECCWEWKGWLGPKNYGSMWVRVRGRQKHFVATHVSYCLHKNTPLKKGLFILHSCDNPPCVNPHHLRRGTHQENMEDRQNRNRQFRPQGELHGESKLIEAQVRKIRRIFLGRNVSYLELAAKFSVSSVKIGQIVRGDAWAHVDDGLQERIDKKLQSRQLSEDDVVKIRRLFVTGRYTQAELGQQFGINGSSISAIVRGVTHQEASGPTIAHAPTFGTSNGNARLDEASVREIRRLYAEKRLSQRALAREFSVSQRTVTLIVNRRTWARV